MGKYHHIYMNNPTAGAADGTQVSEDRAQTSPLSVVLNASSAETKVIKCAIRCIDGYKTAGNTTITRKYWDGSAYKDTGGNISKWQFAPDLSQACKNTYTIDNNAASGDTITINGLKLTAGSDFAVGSTATDTAANIAKAFNEKSTVFKATSNGAAFTLIERYPGSHNIPGDSTITGTILITDGAAEEYTVADEAKMLSDGVWSDSITIADEITNHNVIFWVKVTSASTDDPVKDTSTAIYVSSTVGAV